MTWHMAPYDATWLLPGFIPIMGVVAVLQVDFCSGCLQDVAVQGCGTGYVQTMLVPQVYVPQTLYTQWHAMH